MGATDDVSVGAMGGALGVWFIIMIYRLFRKPVPEVVFGTRCPHFQAFAIRLKEKADRMRLLEEVTTLLSKNQ
ncbi:hypothetical protein PI126_g23580 [Phytophthora idaei]|nr:hypothetical protein PI126_g23580 [Phytophthora idaei]